MRTYIRCNRCGYEEEFNKELFIKIMGTAMVGGGFWAWVTYIFAGTGFALPICIAIVIGGLVVMAYADLISKWLNNRYVCPGCGQKNWSIVKK